MIEVVAATFVTPTGGSISVIFLPPPGGFFKPDRGGGGGGVPLAPDGGGGGGGGLFMPGNANLINQSCSAALKQRCDTSRASTV